MLSWKDALPNQTERRAYFLTLEIVKGLQREMCTCSNSGGWIGKALEMRSFESCCKVFSDYVVSFSSLLNNTKEDETRCIRQRNQEKDNVGIWDGQTGAKKNILLIDQDKRPLNGLNPLLKRTTSDSKRLVDSRSSANLNIRGQLKVHGLQ
jgi:hypothetical protein